MSMKRDFRVAHFQRRMRPGRFSQEGVIEEVRRQLAGEIEVAPFYCPHESNGIGRLLKNSVWARRHVMDINHIIGDVHYLALSLPAETTLLTVHDCVLIVQRRGLKRLFFRLLWYRLPIARARIVTAVSEFTKRQLVDLAGCDPRKIVTIPNPVLSGFSATTRAFRGEEPVILQVGTGWNKNLPRVAEALKGIRCRLEIVGPLDARQSEDLIRNQIKHREHRSLDHRSMVSLYQSCDMVIFASVYEGFGLPILEGQASARPVVTSDICSMPEVGGNAACYVSPLRTESIREGVLRIIEDRVYREGLVERGLENIRRFDPKEVSNRYLALYDSVIQPVRH